MDSPTSSPLPHLSRRQALQQTTTGFAWLAFSALAHQEALASRSLAPKAPHFPARAKRVIMLTMPGAPSHVDTFDYKPQLTKDHGKPGKYGNLRGATLLGSPWEFKQHGQGGIWISELFPHVASMADDICLLRGMHTDIPNHNQAQLQMHTGSFQFARPSIGVWTLYGLGSVSGNLPGFIWMNAGKGANHITDSSFLPAQYQGTSINMPRGGGDNRKGGRKSGRTQEGGVRNIKNPAMSPGQQRKQLDFIQALNQDKLQRETHHTGIDGVIESYELAFRMQAHLPEVMDFSNEPQPVQELYGIGASQTDEFGRKCLLARRMAEAGVRFIELGHSPGWDTHGNLKVQLAESCQATDRPIAGLLKDLKQRDMLKDTLVIWSGEFGRTPHGQNGNGRDHNAKGYTSWMAGAGVKGGFSYGNTDEHGYEAVEGKMHIRDWHATILHLLGLDHERLTYRYAGRDFRLTDVGGRVAKDILA